ncbi:hypothetical protein ACH4T9_27045 [Micromonospora sp. NPDC020750]|uniref:hypothetical protein n=1 Tax=unclassified Micromonospora TaxID=2617518 RepID=UPI0037AC88A2
MKAIVKGAVLGLALVPALATPALASGPEHIMGDCGFASALVEGANIRTVAANNSTISLKYTNGMGATNNVSLRISPISVTSGDAFAGTTVVGPGTGGTWNLATEVLATTRFTLNYRSSVNINANADDHWEGDLRW